MPLVIMPSGKRVLPLGITLILLLLGVRPVAADDTAFRASMVAAVVAHAADLAETQRCLGSGRCREVNPWLARFESPSAFAVAQMGVVSAQLWALAKLHERKPKLATAINFATAGVFAGIAVHNAKVAR